MIGGCEVCSEDAELPFENILDRLNGSEDGHRFLLARFFVVNR